MTVTIHVWRRLGPDQVVVLDDESLALIEVDSATARLLVQCDSLPEGLAEGEDPCDSRGAVVKLIQDGVIHRTHVDAVKPQFQLTYMLMNISHVCDMECRYCFAGGGNYGDAGGLMCEDIAQRAIDMLAASECSGPKRIAFFGGEPLANPRTLRFILEYGRDVIGDRTKLGFMISTNGTNLNDETIKLLSDNDVSIQISIDGTSELQNHLRPLRRNGDSFGIVNANLKKALKGAPSLHGRATVTNICPDAMDLAAQLFSLGLRSISLQPVHGCEALELSDQQMEQLGDGYRLLARRGMDRQVSWIKSYIERIARRARTEEFCGAGLRGVTVAPDGSFYVCHRLIPLEEFRIGDVWSGVDVARIAAIFDGKQGVDGSLVCRTCLFRHMCGGGCMAENYLETGDIREPWARRCILTKKVSQAAIDSFLDQRYRTTSTAAPSEGFGDLVIAQKSEVPANG
jgi:uncharacterized protein